MMVNQKEQITSLRHAGRSYAEIGKLLCISSEKWWKEHPEQIGRKAIYAFFCVACGNSKRKYCSHKCYVFTRFKGGENFA